MGHFQGMRRALLGGWPPPLNDGQSADIAQIRKDIGDIRKLLEKMMADHTTAEILALVQAQTTEITSMSALVASLRDRVNAFLAGKIDPTTQAGLNEMFAELQGNNAALVSAYNANVSDPATTGTGGTTPPALVSTSTNLSASNTAPNVGDNVTLSASVTGATSSKPITGTVSFFDGTTLLGAENLDSTGVAAFATSTLAAGSHSIDAEYSGDTNYATSTSSAVTVSVSAPAAAPTAAPAAAPSPAPAPTPEPAPAVAPAPAAAPAAPSSGSTT